MPKTKQTKKLPALPIRIAERLDKLEAFVKSNRDRTGHEESLQDLEQLEYQISVLVLDLDEAKSDLLDAEDKISALEEQAETRLDKSSQNGLVSIETLRDPSNWTDGKWTPVLGATEPDIHRYMDQVFKQIEEE